MSVEYVNLILSLPEEERRKEINKLSIPELVMLDRILKAKEDGLC